MRADIVRDTRLDPLPQDLWAFLVGGGGTSPSMDLTASTGMTAEISEISALWARR